MSNADKLAVPSLYEDLSKSLVPAFESIELLKTWWKERDFLFGNFFGNANVKTKGKKYSVLHPIDNSKMYDITEVCLRFAVMYFSSQV
jgi:hypothetical protein